MLFSWYEDLRYAARPKLAELLRGPIGRELDRAFFPVRDQISWRSAGTWFEKAEEKTGLSTWDPVAKRCFAELVEGYAASDRLSSFGRFTVRQYFLRRMANHLEMNETIRRHPEILDIPVQAPIVITGWFRTGTTLLHNLLRSDRRFRAPLMWELWRPCPPLDRRDDRYERAYALFEWNRALIPEQRPVHDVTADSPEECFFLLENAGPSLTALNSFQQPQHAQRLNEEVMDVAYGAMKTQLQILTWSLQRAGVKNARELRWCLKCPWHLWHLDSLTKIFPGAKVICTHRDPIKSLVSNASLSAITTRAFAPHGSVEEAKLGRWWMEYYDVGLRRSLEARERGVELFDLPLRSLLEDLEGSMEALYDFCGEAIGQTKLEVYRGTLAAQSRSRSGKHTYDAKRYGLNEAEIRERFAIVYDRFLR